jgi:hypothetical protein
MQQSAIKLAIFEKLAEVEAMLLEASCEGEQLAELACFSEVDGALSTLVQAVDYYVD